MTAGTGECGGQERGDAAPSAIARPGSSPRTDHRAGQHRHRDQRPERAATGARDMRACHCPPAACCTSASTRARSRSHSSAGPAAAWPVKRVPAARQKPGHRCPGAGSTTARRLTRPGGPINPTTVRTVLQARPGRGACWISRASGCRRTRPAPWWRLPASPEHRMLPPDARRTRHTSL